MELLEQTKEQRMGLNVRVVDIHESMSVCQMSSLKHVWCSSNGKSSMSPLRDERLEVSLAHHLYLTAHWVSLNSCDSRCQEPCSLEAIGTALLRQLGAIRLQLEEWLGRSVALCHWPCTP